MPVIPGRLMSEMIRSKLSASILDAASSKLAQAVISKGPALRMVSMAPGSRVHPRRGECVCVRRHGWRPCVHFNKDRTGIAARDCTIIGHAQCWPRLSKRRARPSARRRARGWAWTQPVGTLVDVGLYIHRGYSLMTLENALVSCYDGVMKKTIVLAFGLILIMPAAERAFARNAEASVEQLIEAERTRIARKDLLPLNVGRAHNSVSVQKRPAGAARTIGTTSPTTSPARPSPLRGRPRGVPPDGMSRDNASTRYDIVVKLLPSQEPENVRIINEAHTALLEAQRSATKADIRVTALYLILLETGWAVRDDASAGLLKFSIQEESDFHRSGTHALGETL